jgi:hypothetical protein
MSLDRVRHTYGIVLDAIVVALMVTYVPVTGIGLVDLFDR